MQLDIGIEVNFSMIERTERIHAEYELSTRKARWVEKYPQGQLGFDDADPEKYIIEADGAVEFFEKLVVEASTTAEWAIDGISSIRIEIRYGPDGQDGWQELGEVLLSPTSATGVWQEFSHKDLSLPQQPTVYWYEYRVEVNYVETVALGETESRVTSLGHPDADGGGWFRTTARNLVIHPRDLTPAFTVEVGAGVINFQLVQRAAVELAYGEERQHLDLTEQEPSRRLVARGDTVPEDTELVTSGTLFYADGARIPLPEEQWQPGELIHINQPRSHTLALQVLLADPNDDYERAEVRLRYSDANRVLEHGLELTDHGQDALWEVRLEDPDQRAWEYRATLIRTDGGIETTDWTGGEGDLLIVGVEAAELINVAVDVLVLPDGEDLLALTVEMAYDDEENDVHWEHSELIRSDHTGHFEWAIALADPAKRGYRYRVNEFRRAGRTEGAWQEETTRSLVVLPSQ